MSSFLSRQSTFDRGFALLASLLCSFQCTSGDEKRKSGIGAVTTVTVRIGKIFAARDSQRDVF